MFTKRYCKHSNRQAHFYFQILNVSIIIVNYYKMQSGRNALLTTFSSDLRFASQSHRQILRRRNVGLFSGQSKIVFVAQLHTLLCVCATENNTAVKRYAHVRNLRKARENYHKSVQYKNTKNKKTVFLCLLSRNFIFPLQNFVKAPRSILLLSLSTS